MLYNIFGSADSLDVDILVKIDKPLSISECKAKCLELDSELSKHFDKKVNTNLCVTDFNTLSWVYKGSLDEVNNSILATYENHTQNHGKFVNQQVVRNLNLKVARSIRTVIQYLSRSKYRAIIKKALLSDTKVKLDVLMSINFTEQFSLEKIEWTEYAKVFAFQYAQIVCLYESIEIYTKNEASFNFPEYSDFIYRKSPVDMQKFQKLVLDFCTHIQSNYDLELITEKI